jgi:hypothetical protein
LQHAEELFIVLELLAQVLSVVVVHIELIFLSGDG